MESEKTNAKLETMAQDIFKILQNNYNYNDEFHRSFQNTYTELHSNNNYEYNHNNFKESVNFILNDIIYKLSNMQDPSHSLNCFFLEELVHLCFFHNQKIDLFNLIQSKLNLTSLDDKKKKEILDRIIKDFTGSVFNFIWRFEIDKKLYIEIKNFYFNSSLKGNVVQLDRASDYESEG